MLLTNHALTGALLGLSIDNEAILLPTAIASHYAMDALPHIGGNGFDLKRRSGKILGYLDVASAVCVTITICAAFPTRVPHLLLGVGGAILPDLFWIPTIFFGLVLEGPQLRRFHIWVQWAESRAGTVVDLLWACGMIGLLALRQ